MSLTNLLVPTYTHMLQTLSGLLDKAQKQFPEAEAEALLSKRLAPDMLPLSSQVCFACLQAQEPAYRTSGKPLPEALEQLALAGRNAGDHPGSISDAQARIAQALAALGALGPDALDVGGDRVLTLALPNGVVFDMTHEAYARDWALAQFYFHIVTAYAILRNHDVEIGKADYVPHMFSYLRTGEAA